MTRMVVDPGPPTTRWSNTLTTGDRTDWQNIQQIKYSSQARSKDEAAKAGWTGWLVWRSEQYNEILSVRIVRSWWMVTSYQYRRAGDISGEYCPLSPLYLLYLYHQRFDFTVGDCWLDTTMALLLYNTTHQIYQIWSLNVKASSGQHSHNDQLSASVPLSHCKVF